MLDAFIGIHKGETALLVGNGANLHLTPPAELKYPSFGMNTIHRYEGWIPDYYVAVDQRVLREFGDEINERFADVPKFVPTPHLDAWQGENVYRFNHLAHELWGKPWNIRELPNGFAYHSVMHAAMQLAALMGFTTLLMIGVEHKPDAGRMHFWGEDERMPHAVPLADWLRGYKVLVDGMAAAGVRVLNISQDTYCPADVIPRADWQKWRTYESNYA